MITKNALMVHRNRFESPRRLVTRSASPPSMDMQQFLNTMTRMCELIEVLALRESQLPEIRPSRSIQVDVKPIVRKDESLLPQTETEDAQYKVRRSALLDQFE